MNRRSGTLGRRHVILPGLVLRGDNLDITLESDVVTVSRCWFSYVTHDRMHRDSRVFRNYRL